MNQTEPWGHHYQFSVYIEGGESLDSEIYLEAASVLGKYLEEQGANVEFIGVRYGEVQEKPLDQIGT